MDEKTFAELMESAGEALEHAKGKLQLKTTLLPEVPKPMTSVEIKSLRRKLNASQAVFAHYLNVSPKLVQAWEARRRRPQGAAVLLLRIADRSPKSLMEVFISDRSRKARAGVKPVSRGRQQERRRA